MDRPIQPPRSVYVQDLTLAIEDALSRGDWDTAVSTVTAACAAAPWDPAVLTSVGAVHEISENYNDAMRLSIHAVCLNPDNAAAWQNLSMMAGRGVGVDDPQMVALLTSAMAMHANPKSVLPAWNTAYTYRALGHVDQAERLLHEVEKRLTLYADAPCNKGPYNEFNRAFMHLCLGSLDPAHYPLGFAAYERRLVISSHQLHDRARTRLPADVPRWTGGPLPTRLAVFAEQGLGDTLMCLRYVLQMAEDGCEVVLEPQGPLVPLLRERLSHPRVTVIDFGAPLPDGIDAYVWAMSLSGIFWRGPDSIPSGLTMPRPWRRPDSRRCVAFAWQGSRSHRSDRVRSAPPEIFEAVAHACRAAGLTPIACNHGEPTPAFLDEPPTITSMADTASLLDQCVGVISIDSALVHLAGSMGVTTLACLSAYPDWRWGLQDPPLPWYDCVQTARQHVIGDWSNVTEAARQFVASLSTPLQEAA